jgi:hypothetical protein
MLSTLATEALATLEEAERLLAALPPGTPDHESASANVARARETIYGARAGFRVIRTRQERNGSN